MITLPSSPGPSAVTPALVDPGLNLRGALGGGTVRVTRPGARFRIGVTYPPLAPANARVIVSRLIRAKFVGLRIPFPLLGESQAAPGNPVVNGAGQAGTAIALRGFAADYPVREGAWLSIVGNGQHYLHNVTNAVTASGAGEATVNIAPALRFPFPDGAVVHFAQPMIEGFVEGETADWAVGVNRLVQVAFTIEEFA